MAIPADGSVIDKRVNDERVVFIVKVGIVGKVTAGELPKGLLELVEVTTGFGKVAAEFSA